MLKRHVALCCSIAFFACLFIACGGGGSESGSEIKAEPEKTNPEIQHKPKTDPNKLLDPVVPEKITRRIPERTTKTNPISKPKPKPKPDPKPEKKPDPQEEEEAAEKLVELAVDQISNRRFGEAKKLMLKILKRYPNTETAKKVKKMLDDIKR